MTMNFEPKLVAKVEVPSTKWHSIRERFRYIFNSNCIDNVERWYSTMAGKEKRDGLRECMRAIHEFKGALPAKDSLPFHKATHFADLYGAVLSQEGKKKVAAWVASPETSESLIDMFRTCFSAIQVSTFSAISVTKETFIPKTKVDEPAVWGRKKIDWQSDKVAHMIQENTVNPMAGRDMLKVENKPKRFTKPKSQFDGDIVMKSLGLDGANGLDLLRQKREAAANAREVFVDETTGCKTFKKSQKGENISTKSSGNRIIAPFMSGGTTHWRTTSKELIRNLGPVSVDRVDPVNHPSMGRVTASLGMMIPHPSNSGNPKR